MLQGGTPQYEPGHRGLPLRISDHDAGRFPKPCVAGSIPARGSTKSNWKTALPAPRAEGGFFIWERIWEPWPRSTVVKPGRRTLRHRGRSALRATWPGRGRRPAGVVPPGARGGTRAGTGERGAEAHGSRCPLGRTDAAQYEKHQFSRPKRKGLHDAQRGPPGGSLVPAVQPGALATGTATRPPTDRSNRGVSAVLTSPKPVADSIQGPWISACLRWMSPGGMIL